MDPMCHYHEARDWAALREEVEEAEAVEADAPTVEADLEDADPADRLAPIQPSD